MGWDEGKRRTKEQLIHELAEMRERVTALETLEVRRKRIEEALRKSEIRFRELYNNMSSGVAVYDVKDDGRNIVIRDINKAGERISRVEQEDVVGKSILEVFPGVKEFGLFDVLQRVWRTGEPEHFPVAQYMDDRLSHWAENYVYKLPSGEVVAVYDDITERKRAEEALRESENRYRALFDSAGDAIFIHDLNGQFLEVNQVACERLGYSREELLQMTPMDIDSPEYAALMAPRIEELRRRGHVFLETAHVRRDGTVIPIELSSRTIEYEGRLAILSIARDITERKQAEEELRRHRDHLGELVKERTIELEREITERKQVEEALREAYEQLAATLNALPDLLFEIDRRGCIHDFRAPHPELLYTSPQEFLGQTVDKVLPEAVASIIMDAIAQAVEWGQHTGATYSLDTPMGVGWFELSLAAKGRSRAPDARFVALVRDITERKRAEAALEERLQFEALLSELSATFVNLPASDVDRGIEHWLQRTTEFLDADRSMWFEFNEDMTQAHSVYAFAAKGFPLPPSHMARKELPYYFETLCRGEVFMFSGVDNLPAEAAAERLFFVEEGVKANLTLPLRLCGKTLGTLGFGALRVERAWPDDLVQRLEPVVEIFVNALQRQRAEEKREKLILELEDALTKVKTLSGLLPICASCKKIRDDQGYWTQVEVYIRDHSEVEFSHGICPDCYRELYPSLHEDSE